MQILVNEMMTHQNVLLVGPPGIAKTAIIHDVAKKCGYATEIDTVEGRMSTVIRASLMERVDLTGCLVPDQKNGVTRQLPFVLIKALQETKDKVMFFIDDLGQSPMDAQAAIMRLFDNNFFPESLVVWAATNRPGDKAGVSALCEPLRSRFHSAYCVPVPGDRVKADGGVLLCEWTEYAENWVDWALDNGAPPEIIAWHRSTNGNNLYTWTPCADPSVRMADFRSWGAMIKRWNSGLRSMSSVSGVIGKAAAAEFLAFASLSEGLPSPDQVWMDPSGAPVPSEISAQYLISSILAQQVQVSCIEAFVTYIARLKKVMTGFAGRDAYRRLGASVSGSKGWTKWFLANREMFNLDK